MLFTPFESRKGLAIGLSKVQCKWSSGGVTTSLEPEHFGVPVSLFNTFLAEYTKKPLSSNALAVIHWELQVFIGLAIFFGLRVRYVPF